jgi:hypothetical protein
VFQFLRRLRIFVSPVWLVRVFQRRLEQQSVVTTPRRERMGSPTCRHFKNQCCFCLNQGAPSINPLQESLV